MDFHKVRHVNMLLLNLYLYIYATAFSLAGGPGDQLRLSERFFGKFCSPFSHCTRTGGTPAMFSAQLDAAMYRTCFIVPTCQIALGSVAVKNVLVNSMDESSDMVKARSKHVGW